VGRFVSGYGQFLVAVVNALELSIAGAPSRALYVNPASRVADGQILHRREWCVFTAGVCPSTVDMVIATLSVAVVRLVWRERGILERPIVFGVVAGLCTAMQDASEREPEIRAERRGVMFSKRRLPIALFAVVLILPLTSVAVSAANPSVDGFQRAEAFRTSLGLQSDAGYVANVEGNPSASRKYGVALLPDEQRDIDARVAVDGKIPSVIDSIKDQPGFAGAFIDQAAGGVLDLATTGDTDALVAQARLHLPPGIVLRVRTVTYTDAQLQAANQAVNDDIEYWTMRGVAITEIGVDPEANRVDVGVSSNLAVARHSLATRYGSIVVVASKVPMLPTSTCNSRQDCVPPVRGGLYIISRHNCSSGYVARSGSGVLVLVTAGHCFRSYTDIWKNSASTATVIGTTYSYTTNDSTSSGTYNADAGYIALAPGSMQTTLPHNQFYVTSTTTFSSFTSVAPSNHYANGTLVCKSGATTQYTCGVIVQQEMTKQEASGPYVRHVAEAAALVDGGDSGSPVFYGSYPTATLLGIVIAADNPGHPPLYYSPENWIGSALGGAPCTTPSC